MITALIFRFSILSILQQIKRTPITIGENKIAIKINIIFCLLKISFDNCFFSLSLMSQIDGMRGYGAVYGQNNPEQFSIRYLDGNEDLLQDDVNAALFI